MQLPAWARRFPSGVHPLNALRGTRDKGHERRRRMLAICPCPRRGLFHLWEGAWLFPPNEWNSFLLYSQTIELVLRIEKIWPDGELRHQLRAMRAAFCFKRNVTEALWAWACLGWFGLGGKEACHQLVNRQYKDKVNRCGDQK